MKMPPCSNATKSPGAGRRVDRDWWIVAKLVAMTVVALIAAAVFGVL